MKYRAGSTDDVEAVAALHADSWRRNYRGVYADSYLDGDVFADRRALWTARLTHASDDHYTIVAEHEGSVVGFAHTIVDCDPVRGALLDNLHVAHERKGQGIGRALMAESVRALTERRPSSGLYLLVLEQNTAAQAFYEACGGTRVERRLDETFPGGGTAWCFVYSWPHPSELLDAD